MGVLDHQRSGVLNIRSSLSEPPASFQERGIGFSCKCLSSQSSSQSDFERAALPDPMGNH